jgi:RNA polymerase sigma-70 factor (ECF subfamily)
MSGLRPHLVRHRHTDPPELVQDRVEALFREHYAGLCSFVGRYLKSRAVAEEVVQELFLRLWERLKVSEPVSGGPPLALELTRSYLYAAARNRALNVLQRERLERKHVEYEARLAEVPERTVDHDFEHRELIHAARRAIAALPDRCRMVFDLSRRRGLTYAEIGHVLGISVKAVEANMARALKTLRSSLDQATLVTLAVSLHALFEKS